MADELVEVIQRLRGVAEDAASVDRPAVAAEADLRAFRSAFNEPMCLRLLSLIEAGARLREQQAEARRLYLQSAEEPCEYGTDDSTCPSCGTFARAETIMERAAEAWDAAVRELVGGK